MSEPFVDGDGGVVVDGKLVVPGGDGAVAFESVDGAFNCVALLVDLCVEGGRPAAWAASVLAVADLVVGSGIVQHIPRRRREARLAREL